MKQIWLNGVEISPNNRKLGGKNEALLIPETTAYYTNKPVYRFN
jgi:hypothetical protein